MALSQSSLKGKIVSELEARGFTANGEHAFAAKMAEAIAAAVVAEITSNAQVQVTGGSSSGTYKVS
ncbi:hypothetical protein ACVBIO_03340 [Shewanella sp. 0m-8]